MNVFAAAVLSVLSCGPEVPDMDRGFLFRSVAIGGEEIRYAAYVPRGYARDGEDKWPLVVFLNGKGECGRDGQKQLAVGLAPAVNFNADRWPCVIIFAQKPEAEKAWEEYDGAVMAMIAAAEKEWRIDVDREYLTGLSQGGHGTWAIAALHPEKFAAIAPVCGYGDPAQVAPRIAGMPVWAFHGAADSVVPAEQSEKMVAAVRAAGGAAERVKLTIYPGVNHNSWDRAYGDAALPAWLLAQRRGK